MEKMRLVIASGNGHKIEEIAAILAGAGLSHLQVVGMKSLGRSAPDIDESADDFAGNALLKVQGVSKWLAHEFPGSRDLVLADDSGICIDRLGGQPGIHSARFAGSNKAGEEQDRENNKKVIHELERLGHRSSGAHYEVVLALMCTWKDLLLPTENTFLKKEESERGGALLVRGRCDGEFRSVPQGERGFGYDPHFWLSEESRSFAELGQEEKSKRSHRGQAMRALIRLLAALSGQITS